MRFDQFIRPGMIIRDVKHDHPETVEIFDNFGFRGPCDDCSIEQVARKYGVNSLDVVGELNNAVLDKAV
jgi:hypothetical protein